jgi:hypothetical protein
MDFYSLAAIVAAEKKPIPLQQAMPSFHVSPARDAPYIQPTFNKIEFPEERPSVLLVSAVGATGKTTLAQVLSQQTGLPLLDLSTHKPVADNSVTGLLTSAYRVEDLTALFEGIRKGTFGLIVDGIDEGRSKTTEKGFEAFLDDIARLCLNSPGTSFVLLGRTQTLEESWLYLTYKGVSTGLICISPFDLERARGYVDAFALPSSSAHPAEYSRVRDGILARLGAAFNDETTEGEKSFLSFIGYPPVLDAIATLLREEQNYHRLEQELNATDVNDVEISLLHRIASYILARERTEKVLPNILFPIVADMPAADRSRILDAAFGIEEQCTRLVAHCLKREATGGWIQEPVVDEQYEAQLVTFVPQHPFVTDHRFRSAVFEAMAVSTLVLSGKDEAVRLALDYCRQHKANYHLVYLLHHMAAAARLPIDILPVLLASAQEFRSRSAAVEITVDGSGRDRPGAATHGAQIDIEVEISMGEGVAQSRVFTFLSEARPDQPIRLGHRLSSTSVTVPGWVVIGGEREIEITPPVDVRAAGITLEASELVLRPPVGAAGGRQVTLECDRAQSDLTKIATNGMELILSVADRTGLAYPAIQYVEDKKTAFADPLLREKYLRLRRIFVHFRSHSRGALAKYRRKIEHERVLRNALGERILARCLNDGILKLDGDFYFLQPAVVNEHLGISYDDLSKGRTSERLAQYLGSID